MQHFYSNKNTYNFRNIVYLYTEIALSANNTAHTLLASCILLISQNFLVILNLCDNCYELSIIYKQIFSDLTCICH